MNYQTIEIRHEGAIDWLTLNRPGPLERHHARDVR